MPRRWYLLLKGQNRMAMLFIEKTATSAYVVAVTGELSHRRAPADTSFKANSEDELRSLLKGEFGMGDKDVDCILNRTNKGKPALVHL